jgi:membrane-associated protein
MSDTRAARRRPLRRLLLGLAAARLVIGIAAIVAAPFLYEHHFVLLVLLRPTKEVLLAGGFFLREGDVSLLPMVLATLPILYAGVWIFHGLGRAYEQEITDADLPGIAGRLLPPERIEALSDALADKGMVLVVLGRLAAFPSSLLAAAAGSSGLSFRRFVVADAIGATLSLVEVIGAGYLLGEAHDVAGPWITGVGVLVLAVMVVIFGRTLKDRERRPSVAPAVAA